MHLVVLTRNESARIQRTIESALPLIDSWTVLDTGSTDDTIEVVHRTVGCLPGQVVRAPWTDSFADARNRAFDAARAYVCQTDKPYLLHLDAGEQIGTDGPMPELTADAYQVPVSYGGCRFHSTRIFRARAPWVWRYRIHELAVGGGPVGTLDAGEIFSDLGDQSPAKYENYARLSALDLAEHPNDPRVVFYAAQNFYAVKRYADALNLYALCTTLGGWSEEVWYARMREGMCFEMLGRIVDAAESYREAFEMAPHRAEPARHLARMLQSEKWADVADSISLPISGLFIEPSKYKQ
jgi:glycosyltransferase involved in cell wall biosynthesis